RKPDLILVEQRLLEKGKFIRGYVALLDQDQVGLPVSVFVSVRLSAQTEEHLLAFEREVAEVPEVMECYVMSGVSDYLLRVVTADLAAYEELLRTRLTRMPGVRGVESAFALKRVVYRTNLPLRRVRRS
ncbi:MAG: Lrp/AsnC family transcriptional regulator, partial [Alphaproteobacteria bacterium]